MERRDLLKLLGLAPVAVATRGLPPLKAANTVVSITNAANNYSTDPITIATSSWTGYGGGFSVRDGS